MTRAKCKDCLQALAVKHWAIFNANCAGCKVRAIASGPAFFDAIKSNTITPRYRDELQASFGASWKAGHEAVKKERKRLEAMK